MATVKITSTTGLDFDGFDLPDPVGGTVASRTPTKWHIDRDKVVGSFDEYVGKGFTFDKSNDLIGGTITGFTIAESKTEKFQVTGISIDASVLTGAATGKAFLAQALSGADTITGGNGNDHI